MRMFLGICLIVTLFNAAPCLAATSDDLINNAHLYDGKVIEYQGEVVGDIMVRSNSAWLNVNDGSRAIGVWTAKQMAKKIKLSGSYRFIGDTIKVTGIFHRACPEHGGDLDIHAQNITIIKNGYQTQHTINSMKLLLAAILFAGVIILLIYPMFFKKKT